MIDDPLIIEEANRYAFSIAHEYGCHVCASVLWQVVERLDPIIRGKDAKKVAEALEQIRRESLNTINEQYLEALRELAEQTDRRLSDD